MGLKGGGVQLWEWGVKGGRLMMGAWRGNRTGAALGLGAARSPFNIPILQAAWVVASQAVACE